MSVVDLDRAKQHLRVDFPDEDALIEALIPAAVGHVSTLIHRSIPWKDEAGAEVDVPSPVVSAILLVLGDLYVNREAQSTGKALVENQTVNRLLSPYKKMRFF